MPSSRNAVHVTVPSSRPWQDSAQVDNLVLQDVTKIPVNAKKVDSSAEIPYKVPVQVKQAILAPGGLVYQPADPGFKARVAPGQYTQ